MSCACVCVCVGVLLILVSAPELSFLSTFCFCNDVMCSRHYSQVNFGFVINVRVIVEVLPKYINRSIQVLVADRISKYVNLKHSSFSGGSPSRMKNTEISLFST